MAALIQYLGMIWSASPSDDATTPAGDFVDLGCGDGRVVIEVLNAFPDRRGVGMDLQAALIERAAACGEETVTQKKRELAVQSGICDTKLGAEDANTW